MSPFAYRLRRLAGATACAIGQQQFQFMGLGFP